jgi:hypothetical protein
VRPTERFSRWLRRDDDAMEWYLSLVGGSLLDDADALASINSEHLPEGVPPVTEATVRTWARDDSEFADALKVARQMRAQERAHEPDLSRQAVGPERWPMRGRLDLRHDPYRISHEQAYGDPSELG